MQRGTKQYGLSFPTLTKGSNSKTNLETVFNVDSDEEVESKELKLPNFSRSNSTLQARIHRNTKLQLEKALKEDPSVFQYDEIFEEVRNDKPSESFKNEVKKPKYVDRLKKSACERKLERQLCIERKAHKEIESEAELFGDKEVFLTSAYKEKLEELNDLVNKHSEKEKQEELMDIRKQDGLGGFYRYIYHTGEVEAEEFRAQQNGSNNNISEPSDVQPTEMRSECKSDEKSGSDLNTNFVCKPDSSTFSSPVTRGDSQEHIQSSEEGVNSNHLKSEKFSRKVESKTPIISSRKSHSDPNYIAARPRLTTKEQIAMARERYLMRKSSGIHATIVESD